MAGFTPQLNPSKQNRRDRNVSPTWIHNAEIVAPGAGATLVSRIVGAGVQGFIYGFFISTNDGSGNSFRLNWTSSAVARTRFISFGPNPGSLAVDFPTAFNEGLPADAGSTISITTVNAGAPATIYQAAILEAEI